MFTPAAWFIVHNVLIVKLGICIAHKTCLACKMSYICRIGVICQDCLTAALPIVSPSLCLLSCFLANNGNGKLSLDGYFMHQQSVIQYLWRWRAPRVNLRTIRTLNSWPLRIAPAHSRVGEGARLLRRKPIDWLRNACGETPQSGGNH